MHIYENVVMCEYMPTSSQARRQRRKVPEGQTYCVITSVGVQLVVHRFNNCSPEGKEQQRV